MVCSYGLCSLVYLGKPMTEPIFNVTEEPLIQLEVIKGCDPLLHDPNRADWYRFCPKCGANLKEPTSVWDGFDFDDD